MSRSQKCIRILHTFIDDPHQYEEAFVSATNNGSEIQLLFLNPDSPYAKQRSRDVWPKNSLNPPDDQFVSKQIIYSINVLHSMVEEHKMKNLEVRLYDSLPSVALYVTDDQIMLGFFLIRTKTDSATMMSVSGNTFFTKDLLDEFENRWANAKPAIQ
jgi:predicted transcriptional regulator